MERRKLIQYGVLFVTIGLVIGLIISANFNLMKSGHAGENPVMPSEPPQISELGNIEGTDIMQAISDAFANVAEKVNGSVVTISTETIIKGRRMPFGQFPFEEFFGQDFHRFFGQPSQPQKDLKRYGLGSGVIVSADGIILTNNHVIKGADNIKIRLMDGKEYDGEIKGTDPNTDLAVIKIDAKDLPALKFGDSDKSRVGEWVLAIGSPLSEELAHTVTSGIISAKGRTGLFDQRQYEDFIQTDAAINPGNSGGALVNLRGELVGINTAIASRNGGFMGIGFAIPSNLANKVMTDILEKGRVVRGWLGVYIQDINTELANALGLSAPTGVLISGVQEDSPAKKAGLKAEDVVLKFNDRQVKNSAELRTLVASAGPDTKIKLGILRDGKDKEIEVKLGELTEEVAASSENTGASENIGLQVSDITPQLVEKYNLKVEKDAVVITEVERGSVADQSNLKPGDVILKVNRQTVRNVPDYNKILKSTKPGETLLLYIQRDEARIFVAFTVPEK